MRIVTARMHFPRFFRCKRKTSTFGDRQRIHICPQCNDASRFRSLDYRNDSRFCYATMRDTKPIEFSLYQRRRALFFETQLGMPVNLATQLKNTFCNIGGGGSNHISEVRQWPV